LKAYQKIISKLFIVLICFYGCDTSNFKNKENINTLTYKSILEDLNGNEFTLNNYKGNVIFMNLWATWCKPCIAEFKNIVEAKNILEKDSIKFIAVSNENLEKIKLFIEKNNYNIEFIKLNGDYSLYEAYSLPTSIIYDRSGIEAFRVTGRTNFTSDNFIAKIKSVE